MLARDVASGADRHLDITYGLQVVERSSVVSVLFREAFIHPHISFTSKRFFCYYLKKQSSIRKLTSTEYKTLNGEQRLINQFVVIFISTTTSGVATWLTVTIILIVCLLPFVSFFLFCFAVFSFVIFNAPNKVKEDSILSEHFSSSLCYQLIWECMWLK